MDERTWLEDVEGDAALEWVRERNAGAEDSLIGDSRFPALEAEIREVLEAPDRIPTVAQAGDYLYNFWTDAEHQRGLWRRTTWDSYRSDTPKWEILLDLDALSAAEDTQWVWHGAQVRYPDRQRALITLSPGGSDADVTREFDLTTLTWVEQEPFDRPESKGGVSWIDNDTVLLSTDTGPGSMTRSGYPRVVRRWTRGTPLDHAPELYAADHDDLGVFARFDPTPGYERTLITRAIAFYKSRTLVLQDDHLIEIDAPDSAELTVHRQWLAILLRHDWQPTSEQTYRAGSLLVTELENYLQDGPASELQVLYEPDGTGTLLDVTWTRHFLVTTELRDVQHVVRVHEHRDGDWRSTPLPLPGGEHSSISLSAVDAREDDRVWVTSTGWLEPLSLRVIDLADLPAAHDSAVCSELVKAAPERFDASGLAVGQHWATSADGSRVPYFLIGPADLDLDGSHPTVLYGYGGFEVSLTPSYDAVLGRSWLAPSDGGQQGVYAIANIRGGGEFGPTWHQAALRDNRHRAYEDFVAVARDLVTRGVTSVDGLGCRGGSNGGLLVGNMLTGYPQDFGAIVCQVPLLDMKRYPHLLAGASWMAEYGDPDRPEEWEFIEGFSPYHRFDPADQHPPVLLATSTKDDRVHPGHARKMAELLRAHAKDVTYWENIEGGHGGASTPAQAARLQAIAWTFLRQHLVDQAPREG